MGAGKVSGVAQSEEAHGIEILRCCFPVEPTKISIRRVGEFVLNLTGKDNTDLSIDWPPQATVYEQLLLQRPVDVECMAQKRLTSPLFFSQGR